MTSELTVPAWSALTKPQAERWSTVLGTLTGILPVCAAVVIDSHSADASRVMTDRLASTLRLHGRPNLRFPDVAGASGQVRATVVVIWLRTRPRGPGRTGTPDVVIDLQDGSWPVIRHIDSWLLRPLTSEQ